MRYGVILSLIIIAIGGSVLVGVWQGAEYVPGISADVEEISEHSFEVWAGIPMIGHIVGGIQYLADEWDKFYQLASAQYKFLEGPFAIIQVLLVGGIAAAIIYVIYVRIAGSSSS